MKLIVLAAGKSSSFAGLEEAPPICLSQFDHSDVVLDILVALGNSAGASKSIVVGGYRMLDIMQARPGLSYYFNADWKYTGPLGSLLKCSAEFDDDLLITYSDVVHHRETAGLLLKTEGDVVIAADSDWKTRYEGRTIRQRGRAEVLMQSQVGSHRIVREADIASLQGKPTPIGEYAGLMLVRKSVATELAGIIANLYQQNCKAGMSELVSALDTRSPISVLDLKGSWAELDNEADLASFRFGTKAETLTRLQGMLTKGIILPQVNFTVEEWSTKKRETIDAIRESFSGQPNVVARSSAVNEDSETESMAGNFESILHVPVGDEGALANAIDQVCKSYQKDGAAPNPANQVLIQPMLDQVSASGVAFTADLETAAPYYTIEFDRSGSTESITSGAGGEIETLVIAKNADVKIQQPEIQALVQAIREIETLTGYTSLDIEFAIVSGDDASHRIYIFQVRPIAAHKEQMRVSPQDIDLELESIDKFIRHDKSEKTPLCGSQTAFGVMPDWNPAEIIGINPRPLAFSLYRHVITDDIWGRSREECGYRKTSPRPGLVSFSGKPYVDVRMSFSSFTPKSLDDKTAARLVSHAVMKLNANPEFHDKVEFNVMPTVFDFDFQSKLAEWKAAEFSEKELTGIQQSYFDLTSNLMTAKRVRLELERYEYLVNNRNLARSHAFGSPQELVESIRILLDDCREYGTLPFSNLARLAFVGVTQLKSLVRRGAFSDERYSQFLASIHTVAKQFIDDLASRTKAELIEEYGHLRPGTYDVTSPAYHSAFDQYIDLSNRPTPEKMLEFELTDKEAKSINCALKEEGYSIDALELFEFIREAIQGRELGKFEFSRNLSLAIDLVAELGDRLGLTQDETSFLEIGDILELSWKSIPANLSNQWKSTIESRRRQHAITCAIKLPELIRNENDIWSFSIADTKPNFVTQKTIVCSTAVVADRSPGELDGKICLIENADPGFDWIFSHKIAGLVTAFGGANSHMAIRCAEFEIPAAIGCGEALYRKLSETQKIQLDCAGKKIESIS